MDLLVKNLPEHLQVRLLKVREGKYQFALRSGTPRIINQRSAGFQELSKKGIWDDVPHPALISYAWMKQHRWDDPNEALEFWKGYYKKHKKEYDKLQKQ